jgi:hemolysin III
MPTQTSSTADNALDLAAGPDRAQTVGEEIANSVSHGAGLIAAAIGVPFLALRAAKSSRGPGAVIGAAIFAAAVLLVYSVSAAYHAWPHGKAKRVLRVIEHVAIFLLIAGTYTPFTLGILRGPLGWTLFGLVWALAAAGVILKTASSKRYSGLSIGLYLLMGWLAVVAIPPLWRELPRAGFVGLLAGGLAYTLGVAFYANDHRVKYGHFLWHLFVMAGTACHFFVVALYAL